MQVHAGGANIYVSADHIIVAIDAAVIIVMPDVPAVLATSSSLGGGCAAADAEGEGDKVTRGDPVGDVQQHEVNFNLVVHTGNVREIEFIIR